MTGISYSRKPTKGLVSIVIPTRNGERFIGDTLASIGLQTYTHWEVIVVEDGSDHGSEKIVRDFARQHRWHRVEYSRNERSYGASYSRNLAFAKARGEFVALLDSDDRWFPDHLSVSVQALQSSGKDIVYSTVLMVEDQTELVLGVWGPLAHELSNFPQSLLVRSFVTPSATVIRRQVLEDVGAWDTNLRYCEDYGYWLRCVAAGKQFHHIGGCHCLYRKNHAGGTATTQKMCGLLEEIAGVTAQFINIPGLRYLNCKKYASRAYALAARFHAEGNPLHDPSADISRTPRLLFTAWRLRPQHVEYLLKAGLIGVRNLFRRRKRAVLSPAPAPPVELPRSAAA